MNPIRKAVAGTALVVLTLGGGALGASIANGSAGAATNPTATTVATSPSAGSSRSADAPDSNKGGHTANGITETLLTGDTATQAKAAALKAVPGGTVERVETDAEGAKYEAHVTKSDGSEVTVKMDASFKVTGTESGHGGGH